MFFCFFRILMSYIQIYMIFTTLLHFVINGTCYDITWGQ